MRLTRKRALDQTRSGYGHTQVVIPMAVLVHHIFPYAFDSADQALNIAQTCKHLYHHFRTDTHFWEPFLYHVMNIRFKLIGGGFGLQLKKNYIMWPEAIMLAGGVIGVVQSKLFIRAENCCYSQDSLYGSLKYVQEMRNQVHDAWELASFWRSSYFSVCGLCYKETLPFGDKNYQGGVIRSNKLAKKDNADFAFVNYKFFGNGTLQIDVNYGK